MNVFVRVIIRFAYKTIYIAGIIFIVGLTIYRLTESSSNDKNILNNATSSVQAQDIKSDSFINLVVKPIVESQRNQIIFEGVFWFLLWILLFMLLPSGLLPLKRFKVFNLEFEIGEKEAAAIEKISQNSSKALTMVNYTSEESLARFFSEFSNVGEMEFKTGLEFFLKDLVNGYRDEFDTNIQYKIYSEQGIPHRYKTLMQESQSNARAAVLNKLDIDNPLHNNWLVYYVPDQKFVTVLTSRLSPFDIMDQYLVVFLHNYVFRIVENRNYAMALTEFIEEDDGHTGT